MRRLPELERAPLVETIEFMRTTDMAVVVSQSQNEVADMADLGLDIAKHRKRINEENLDSKFKDPADSFRLVFVCAMWLTGFDAPSCSTIYLDKPMRNHTLMQTIARANRVFPEKDSGLIVDYVGVFRNLEAALAIYGASREGDYTPIESKDALAADLESALAELIEFLDANDIELADLEAARGFEFIALQKAAVETLLVDDATRRRYVSLARRVRTIFKSLLPDPAAQQATHRVAVIRSLAAKLESITEAPDIDDVMDAVSELLDRSVGAEEYVIRSGGDAGPLVDLNQLDFEQLALRFAGSKRTAAKQIERNLEKRLDAAVRKNPTRLDLAERFRRLIDEYNAGTHNLEEFLRRLKAINDELTEEEQRTVREDLSEDELAIYDLLTKPEPELTEAERVQVKATAKRLLAHVTEKLVLDWRKRQHTRAAVQVAVGEILDADLPEVYGPELFDEKVRRVYEHIYASYFDSGESVYTGAVEAPPAIVPVATLPTPEAVDRPSPRAGAQRPGAVCTAHGGAVRHPRDVVPLDGGAPRFRRDAIGRVQADGALERKGAAQGQDDGGGHREDGGRLPQRSWWDLAHRCHGRSGTDRARRRLRAGQARERRRLCRLARHAPRDVARARRRASGPDPRRGHRRPRRLSSRRAGQLTADLGQGQ